MPPKKGNKDQGPAKIKPDLTFGLKNKNKSSKVQAHVKELQSQAAMRGKGQAEKDKQKEKDALAARKAAEQRKKDEVAALYTPIDIVQPKVPFGVDPKTILCAFHKAGRCQKGNKCKYSHDLNQDRKQTKASIYADQRDEKDADTMDKWTDEKLQQVVNKKGNPLATTDIVCKHFIDAVEGGTYGWFWECPGGGDTCKYRHALPPGFVLKSQRKKEEEDAKKKEITLEEFLEVERHKLDQSKLTPLTKESFALWKKTRQNKKDAEADALKAAKTSQFAMGKNNGMSGRDLFTFDSSLGVDSGDEDDGEDDWDLQLLRIRTEKEEREREIERIRQLDRHYGGLSLDEAAGEDAPREGKEAEAKEESKEAEAS
ncbi:hypothetical protein BCR35DRAFT_309681 [Leucosporidium creatinivorum]|uniref:C3H1-type domain-containing protein n=1 Tax=Leucosporidium creatinivorum TaxID=106004 RepID=A0A1Y2DDA3_9BASI|nr:hypothetical protein BCR35DRAFT_309681 [Leucosporidium creatinivorum]